MALRTVATVMIVLIAILLAVMFLAEPFIAVTDSLNDSGDYSLQGEDMNDDFGDTVSAWLNMSWIAIFGVMGWGIYRIVRRELTRGRRP